MLNERIIKRANAFYTDYFGEPLEPSDWRLIREAGIVDEPSLREAERLTDEGEMDTLSSGTFDALDYAFSNNR